MLRRWPLPLALAALLAVPANAADQSVSATAGFDFSPRHVTVDLGDQVTWTNGGGIHNVRFDDGSFEQPTSPSAASWQVARTFDTPGIHRYHCAEHGGPNGFGMSGTVSVRDESGEVPQPAVTAPGLALATAARRTLARVLRGVPLRARCANGCSARFRLVLAARTAKRLGFRARRQVIGVRRAQLAAGARARRLAVPLRRPARKRLSKAGRRFRMVLEARAAADVAETRRRRIVVVP